MEPGAAEGGRGGSEPPRPREPEPPAEPQAGGTCPACRGLGWVGHDVPLGHPKHGKLDPCEVCGVVIRDNVERLRAQSSRSGHALQQTFDDFRLEGLAAPAREAYNAAAEFAARPEGWLVIHGPKGSGKSHLAAAVCNYLDAATGVPPAFVTVPDLLLSLRREVAEGRDPTLAPEVVKVRETPVLILDDLGAQKWTDFAEEQLFLVLDYRSRERLPTMVITNEALESLPGRIASRLADRELSRVVLNPAPDYRWGDGRVTV